MELWEYQVIHLNVEGTPPNPPQASPPRQGPPQPPPAAKRPEEVFSKEYLEKEFPGFYGNPPAAGSPAQEHPAQQLRGFLNQQGRDGWQLVGFYPVGQLLMMIFRRPLPAAPTAPAAPAATAAAPPQPPPPPQRPAAAKAADPAAATPPLERILERLERLESRLATADRALGPAADQGNDSAPSLDPGVLEDGAVLPQEQCRGLRGLEHRSTLETARALGFRSASSLLNPAARAGYRQGLIKRGSNGRVAIYMGSEKNDRGGRDRRFWVVLEPAGP